MSAVAWPTPEPAAPAVHLAALTPPYHLIGPAQVAGVIDGWLQRKPDRIILDTETTGLAPEQDDLVTVQFGDEDEAYIVDMRWLVNDDAPTARLQARQMAEGLLPLFQGGITIGGHNLKFDLRFLARHLHLPLTPQVRVYDTMLAEQVLLGGEEDEETGQRLSATLLATAERYGYAIGKEPRSYFIGLRDRFEWFLPLPTEQLDYIARDCALPSLIARQQKPRLKAEGLAGVSSLEQRVLPVLAAMEHHGVAIDVPGWERYIHDREVEEAALAQRLVRMLSPDPRKPLNIDSPIKLREALNRLPKIVLASTEEQDLKAYKGKNAAIDLLLDYREVNQVTKMFGKSILSKVRDDGRVHPDHKQIIRTGRSTCAQPNWQQLPSHQAGSDTIRHHVVAPPGCKLVIADFSNIEGRFLAELSGEPNLIKLFATGGDFHTETARMIFGLAPDADPSKTFFAPGITHRAAAKTINFALMFGMGAQSMSESLGISRTKAVHLMRLYFQTYRRVKVWLAETGQAGVREGLTRTLSGRVRRYRVPAPPLDRDPKALQAYEAQIAAIERQARNAPVQGSAADATKRALVLLFKRLPAGAFITSVVHDEIVVECPDGLVTVVIEVLEQAMHEAAGYYLKLVANPRPQAKAQMNWVKD